MQDLATLRAGGYRTAGLTKLKIAESLAATDDFPREIFDLGATLELLDLSGTGLSSLPPDFGERLPKLRIAFFSNCRFVRFPAAALAGCAQLEMVAFRSNGMTEVPEEAFLAGSDSGSGSSGHATPLAAHLRWLILTDNRLAALPASIGRCARLEKCMLAGNRLTALPETMAACRRLTLLRLAANRLGRLPAWLFSALPHLAFLSFAGNPCSSTAVTPVGSAGPSAASSSLNLALPASESSVSSVSSSLPQVDWDQIEIHHVLGQGASGVISKGTVKTSGTNTPASSLSVPPPSLVAEDVAVKIFRGALTSDGTPYDEMAACMAAGRHVNLVRIHGQVRFAEEEEEEDDAEAAVEAAGVQESEEAEAAMSAAFQGGLIMELIPPHYRVLGQPPSFDTCTRDNFDRHPDGSAAKPLAVPTALTILAGVASAAEHLHARGIAHGDLYAHNILVKGAAAGSHNEAAAGGDIKDTHAILSDFGAATLYGGSSDEARFPHLEKLEVLAFAHLVEDVLGLLDAKDTSPAAQTACQRLADLHRQCAVETVAARPAFAQIIGELASVQAAVAV